jgi:hypothetical protein
LPGQDAKANLAFHQIMDGVDEVTEVTAKAIALSDDENITLMQCKPRRVSPIGAAVLPLLESLPRAEGRFVCSPDRGDGYLVGLPRVFPCL